MPAITRIETRKKQEGQTLVTELILYCGTQVWDRFRIRYHEDGSIQFMETLCENGVELPRPEVPTR